MGFEVDFLSVGEESRSGDAILTRYGDLFGRRDSQTVVLIDGGFAETADRIVAHLIQYYQTKHLDLIVSTHPDADHIVGLKRLLELAREGKVSVGELWMHRPSRWRPVIERSLQKAAGHEYVEAVKRTLDAADDLESSATSAGIPIREPFTGLTYGDGSLAVVGPSEPFYESLFLNEAAATANESRLLRWLSAMRDFVHTVAESWGLETLNDDGVTSPINNSSAVVMLRFNGEFGLFTADAGMPALSHAADILEGAGFGERQMQFMQVPHHGSRRNVGPTVLDRLLGPRRTDDEAKQYAIVSCAVKGAPKHPSKKVTNAFRRRGRTVFQTGGSTIRHSRDAPPRDGWSVATPVPFYTQVEE